MNAYVAEVWLLTVAALHVPLIPLAEVTGNAGTIPPEQIVNELPKSNAGVMFAVTVTFKLAGVLHCPAAGVNV